VSQEHGAAEEGDDEFTLYRKRMQVSGTASHCVLKCTPEMCCNMREQLYCVNSGVF